MPGLKYIQLYYSYLEAIEPLCDTERGRLFTACLQYSITGTAPELGGNERFIFPMMRAQIDRDNKAYEEKCQRNSVNISKRWTTDKSNEYDRLPPNTNNTKEKGKEKKKDKEKDKTLSTSIERKKGKQEPESSKKQFADFVRMSNDEYSSLVIKLGEHGALRCVEILDNYKGSSGKNYASDYRAILSWVTKRYEEEQQKGDAQYDNSNNGRDGQDVKTYDMSRFHNALDDADDGDDLLLANG